MAASTAVTWEDIPRGDPASERRAQIASLTGLRGFAALMVVLIHTAVLTEYSWLGIPEYGPVSLFVLSGFLLYRPWARWSMRTGPRPSVRQFAIRRLLRIFPAYLAVLMVVALVIPEDRPQGFAGWLRAISLTWIYVPEELRFALIQTWSLGTELSWYVALPLLGGIAGTVARRHSGRAATRAAALVLCLALPLSVAWRSWLEMEGLEQGFTYIFWLPGFLFCFAGGALVAQLLEAERAGAARLTGLRAIASDRWTLLVFALAVALLGTSSIAGPNGFQAITFVEHQIRVACAAALALALLVAAVFGPIESPLNRLLSTRWFNAVGRWSYGIYLWHLPVVVILERDITFPDGPVGLAWRLLWVLALSIPLGAATYAWIERPVMAWSRRSSAVTGPGSSEPTPASEPPAANDSDQQDDDEPERRHTEDRA